MNDNRVKTSLVITVTAPPSTAGIGEELRNWREATLDQNIDVFLYWWQRSGTDNEHLVKLTKALSMAAEPRWFVLVLTTLVSISIDAAHKLIDLTKKFNTEMKVFYPADPMPPAELMAVFAASNINLAAVKDVQDVIDSLQSSMALQNMREATRLVAPDPTPVHGAIIRASLDETRHALSSEADRAAIAPTQVFDASNTSPTKKSRPKQEMEENTPKGEVPKQETAMVWSKEEPLKQETGGMPPEPELSPKRLIGASDSVPENLKKYIESLKGKFRYRPQPDEHLDKYYYPENDVPAPILAAQLGPGNNWVLAGASRRGLSHWGKGTPRDDAFRIAFEGGWNMIVMADGAGGSKYSRETANRSCDAAIKVLAQHARRGIPKTPGDASKAIDEAMREAIFEVHRTHREVTDEVGGDKRLTYATFMMLIHQPMPDKSSVYGMIHVGDGLMFAMSPRGAVQLTSGDHGEVAGTAYFVLNFSVDELAARARSGHNPKGVNFFMVVTDGIEDDLKPSSEDYDNGMRTVDNAKVLAEDIQANFLVWPRWQDWGQFLKYLIDYERRGSFDDRSIAILTLLPDDRS